MEAISAGGAQSAPRIGIAVNLSETPKRPDQAATLNNRVNSVQTAPEAQAGLPAAQNPPGLSAPASPANATTSGLEQQLRQSAVQANSERPAAEASNEGNARSALNTFRNVSQLSSGNTSAIGDSAGITAQVDQGVAQENARVSIEV